MQGFHGRCLVIDLSSESWCSREIPERVLRNYLGGRGLGSYLLLREVPGGIDPLSPENRLIFTTGPLTGVANAASTRYGVFSKSPQTGMYAESYAGGGVGPALKGTGYDAVIIGGRAKAPVYVEVSETGVDFHTARDLWGRGSGETEKLVLERTGPGAEAIVIGPAGENQVRFACLQNNFGRSAGRTGQGAVLGSKQLKALVFHGNKVAPPADRKRLKRLLASLMSRAETDPVANLRKTYGTTSLVAVANEAGIFPTRYWSKGRVETPENIDGDYMLTNLKVESKACPNCMLSCGKQSTVLHGPYQGFSTRGPEYETIYAFGGLCCIGTLEEVVYLNHKCDQLGLDTISAGNMVAFAIEASRRGCLDLSLDYGDTEGIAVLLGQIARREGPGELLARGIREASQRLGLEELAVHVKGLEPAGYDPRVLKGMALAYATSPRGACHLRANFYKPELEGSLDPDAINGKARVFVDYEDRMAVFDTLILCRFLKELVGWEELSELLEATCGVPYPREELKALAARVVDSTRLFNLREGLNKADDTLPDRFFREPLAGNGKRLTREDLQVMVAEYYASRGWDEEGHPRAAGEVFQEVGCATQLNLNGRNGGC